MRLIAAALALLVAAPGWAHEFWIDGIGWQVAPGEPLKAELRVGQSLKGAAYAYFAPKVARFDIVQGDSVTPVGGRAGNRPALNAAAPGDGLAVVVHVTTDIDLTYTEWDKFTGFCEHKDFAWAIARHKERGLPETGFRERYSRHAKALFAVGSGQGADAPQGLVTEIVALANPYTDDLSGGMPVRVLYDVAARADVQVELFEKATDGTVTVTLHRTDAEGVATLPVRPGHMYLVDAVVMREMPGAADMPAEPVWESLWASLTFAMP